MQLQQCVLDELKWDPAVQASDIGVEAKSGLVTLAGHVQSFAQRLAAERAAARVAGVRGIVLEIDVSLPGSSRRRDVDLAQAALQALDWNVSVPKDSVRIVVNNGYITLNGEVDWAYQRAAALGAIQNLVGIAGVDNEITLRRRALDAGELRTRISAAMHRQAQCGANAIVIDTDGGTVTLGGAVDSWSQWHAARRAALSVQGVQDVVNNVVVAAPAHV